MLIPEQVGYSAVVQSSDERPVIPGKRSIQEVTLSIGGMTCASCVGIIESVLKSTDGIEEVVVNLATERGRVIYDSEKIGVRAIITAVEDVGFTATLPTAAARTGPSPAELELAKLWRDFLKWYGKPLAPVTHLPASHSVYRSCYLRWWCPCL